MVWLYFIIVKENDPIGPSRYASHEQEKFLKVHPTLHSHLEILNIFSIDVNFSG